jgi:hypothetical protein
VIYTVTATGRRGHDTATVVITVGVGTTNLAFCFIRNTNLVVA